MKSMKETKEGRTIMMYMNTDVVAARREEICCVDECAD